MDAKPDPSTPGLNTSLTLGMRSGLNFDIYYLVS